MEISFKNSWRVLPSVLKVPSMAEVVVKESLFYTPRLAMQRWFASHTTPTP